MSSESDGDSGGSSGLVAMSLWGLERISSILKASRNREDVVAILVPRQFAVSLADELFPIMDAVAIGIPVMDRMIGRDRDRFLRYVSEGGFVGEIYDIPMLVGDDCVVCTLDQEELTDYAGRYGIDVDAVC